MTRIRLPLNRTTADDLPRVCMICGRHAENHVARGFTWRSPWSALALRVSLILCVPAVILFLAGIYFSEEASAWGLCCAVCCILPVASAVLLGFHKSRRVRVECPMCERHRRYWDRRGFYILAPVLALGVVSITVAILVMADAIPWQVFGASLAALGVLFAIWAGVALIVHRTGLRSIEITASDIVLEPVHSEFADLLRVRRQRKKINEPEYDDGWEDYDPYPRRPLGQSGSG
jgi:hypothetical protein